MFKSAFFPFLRGSNELADAYAEAKVEKERSEARKIAEEASEIAAKKNLTIQREVKEFNRSVDNIFKNDGLASGAKVLKLAKLIEKNPQVVAHLEKAEEIIKKFGLKNNLMNKLVNKSQSRSMGNSIVENG